MGQELDMLLVVQQWSVFPSVDRRSLSGLVGISK